MQAAQHKAQLRAAGLKATAGRMELIHLLERQSKPLSASQISSALGLNVVTVYRALETLVSAGLVRQGSDGRAAHFDYALKPHHHHLVCSDCGFIPVCKTC
jgi:Fur family ferric uptake transcriptional regulator